MLGLFSERPKNRATRTHGLSHGDAQVPLVFLAVCRSLAAPANVFTRALPTRMLKTRNGSGF